MVHEAKEQVVFSRSRGAIINMFLAASCALAVGFAAGRTSVYVHTQGSQTVRVHMSVPSAPVTLENTTVQNASTATAIHIQVFSTNTAAADGATPFNNSNNNSSSNGSNNSIPSTPGDGAGRSAGPFTDGTLRLFIGVLSAAAHKDKRDAVRETWGSDSRLNRVVFVLARPMDPHLLERVYHEAVQYGDMVLLNNITEHYDHLPYQTLEIFKAAHIYGNNTTHVVKCDDDTFVHVDRLLQFVAALPRVYMYAGALNQDYIALRHTDSKWYVSREDWPEDRTPGYWANGPGYLMTIDLAKMLAVGGATMCMSKFLRLEDVACGLWLTCLDHKFDLKIKRIPARVNVMGCAAGDLFSHYRKPEHMRCMYQGKGACC